MPTRMDKERPFDLFSYARRGPGERVQLSKGEIEQIARTVRRTPEVMVKVLPKGANNLGRSGGISAISVETARSMLKRMTEKNCGAKTSGRIWWRIGIWM